MATPTEYVKTISTDFPNGKVNNDDLIQEISNSDILVAFSHINTDDDSISIWFKGILSAGDQTTLNTVVSNHLGNTYVQPPDKVEIIEGSEGTGGNFAVRSINITATAGQEVDLKVHWPFPVSALAVKFATLESMSSDTITMCIGEDVAVGAITSDIVDLGATWTSQAYTVGQKVTYTHPTLGLHTYTCILNTISNEPPTNETFWQEGFEINVSSTVLQYATAGYYIKLSDGTNVSDVGMVVKKGTNSIFVENAPTTTFDAVTPTYVLQTVKVLNDYQLGHASDKSIGDVKIGGSHIPKNTQVCVNYKNNDSITQTFFGEVHFLY